MTSNPYAQMSGGPSGYGGEFLEPVQSRTSVLAVLALVFSLICFVPGSGALAVIFGGAAVLFISTSNGRLRGMGLAITGIVLGLLFTLLWIFMLVGANQAMGAFTQMFLKPADSTMTAIQKGDYTTARSAFTPTASAYVTDEMFADFAARYQQRVGNYKATPDSMWELFSAYGAAGQSMQSVQGRANVIPFPAIFDKGTAIVVLEIDPSGGPPPAPTPGAMPIPVINIGVLTIDGKQEWLVDPKDTSKLLPAAGSDASGDPDADTDPDAAPADAPAGDGGTDGQKPKF